MGGGCICIRFAVKVREWMWRNWGAVDNTVLENKVSEKRRRLKSENLCVSE